MIKFKSITTINAPAHVIFSQYADVKSWHTWDADVEKCIINGEFVTGATGTLKPRKGPLSIMVFREVRLNKSFTTQTKLPLCILSFEHSLESIESATKVTHQVTFEGLTSPIFGLLIGRNIKQGLPHAMARLKKKCEAKP